MLICKYSLWPIFFIQRSYARQRPYARKKWGVAGTPVARYPCRDKKMKRYETRLKSALGCFSYFGFSSQKVEEKTTLGLASDPEVF
jgi:hypothetical protein